MNTEAVICPLCGAINKGLIRPDAYRQGSQRTMKYGTIADTPPLMSLFIDNYRCIVYNNEHKDDVEVVCRMGRKRVAVLPQTQAILEQLGEQIKLARLRRHLSAELVAERAGVSRATVWNVEKGNPSVAIGIYAAVLHALNNMDKDLLLVAKDDELGRKLQDLELTMRKRAPRNGGD